MVFDTRQPREKPLDPHQESDSKLPKHGLLPAYATSEQTTEQPEEHRAIRTERHIRPICIEAPVQVRLRYTSDAAPIARSEQNCRHFNEPKMKFSLWLVLARSETGTGAKSSLTVCARNQLFSGGRSSGPYIGRGCAEDSAERAIEIREISKSNFECNGTDRAVAQPRIGKHAMSAG